MMRSTLSWIGAVVIAALVSLWWMQKPLNAEIDRRIKAMSDKELAAFTGKANEALWRTSATAYIDTLMVIDGRIYQMIVCGQTKDADDLYRAVRLVIDKWDPR